MSKNCILNRCALLWECGLGPTSDISAIAVTYPFTQTFMKIHQTVVLQTNLVSQVPRNWGNVVSTVYTHTHSLNNKSKLHPQMLI